MKARQRKKLNRYTKAYCDCGRIIRLKVKAIVSPWLLDMWTLCKCGNWLGESDDSGHMLRGVKNDLS